MNEIDNKKEQLYDCIYELEEFLNSNTMKLKDCSIKMESSLIDTYMRILFDFYDKTYEFSLWSRDCPFTNKVLQTYEEFMCAFSRVLKFYDCFRLDMPSEMVLYFNQWKERRNDIIQIAIDIGKNEDKFIAEYKLYKNEGMRTIIGEIERYYYRGTTFDESIKLLLERHEDLYVE